MESPSTSPLSLAIFGAGGIARKAYFPLLFTWPGVQIAGVYSRTQRTLDEIEAAWPVSFTTTTIEALLDRSPQAALVLTATPSHAELCQNLLGAGLDVYVEKPATHASHLTRALADLAVERKRIFMTGYNRRFALLYRQAKDIFADRRIQLCTLEKHRTSAFYDSLYGNYLDDIIHQIDLLRYYCGEARALHTNYEMHDGKLSGAVSVAEIEGGGFGIVATSLAAGAWQERVTLHGEGLTVEVNAFRDLRIRNGNHEEVYGLDRAGKWIGSLGERGFSGELEHFFECVRTRKNPETNGYEAAKTEELMERLVEIGEEEKTQSRNDRKPEENK